MGKYIVLAFITFCLIIQCYVASASAADSLKTTVKGSEKYIVHEVEAGQTLYAISRLYGANVQSIKDANNDSVTTLKVGQKILVPIVKNNSEIDGVGTIHIVKSSETLFSISRLYNVKLDDLKEWNNLSKNSISIGQKLVIKENGQDKTTNHLNGRKVHIVEQSQTLYSISKIYEVTAGDLRKWNGLKSDNLDIGKSLIVSSTVENVKTESVSNSSMLPENDSEKENANSKSKESNISKTAEAVGTTSVVGNNVIKSNNVTIEVPAEKIMQKGFAEVIEQTSDTKKYLALHRNAPVGTIMQVRNEMNNQSVFVRIVGPISPTGDNSKVILKISKKAYDRLGAVDSRFPVEISYIP